MGVAFCFLTTYKMKFTSDIIGKTITKISSHPVGERMFIFFTDETYCELESSAGYDGDSEPPVINKDAGGYDYELESLGIISKQEKDRREKERGDKMASDNEAREQAQYEHLKRKFEK